MNFPYLYKKLLSQNAELEKLLNRFVNTTQGRAALLNRQLCSKASAHIFLLQLLCVPRENIQEVSPLVTTRKPQSSSEAVHKGEGPVQISQKPPVRVWEARTLSWKKGGVGRRAKGARRPGQTPLPQQPPAGFSSPRCIARIPWPGLTI